MSNVFVAADFSQLESFLTAYYAQDAVMQQELDDSLKPGGHKVHALNAALLYDIDPADSKTHMVELQGQPATSYKAGKRISHLTNYGGEAGLIARQFWLTKAFATEAYDKLVAKYWRTAQWRQELVDLVFGISVFDCPKCEEQSPVFDMCPKCSGKFRQQPMKWGGYIQQPTHELITNFGRRRRYLGRRGECANPIASQLPQSSGASIWYRTLQRLNGFEIGHVEVANEIIDWPTPPSFQALTEPYQILENTNPTATGTYDSFLLECPESQVEPVSQWLAWTMEQPWPQLGGLRFPVELSVGKNWGGQSKSNPDGLAEVPYVAFSAENPYSQINNV